MNLLAEITLRSTTVLAVGLVVAALLRRQSAALRHGVLAATLAASTIVAPLYWVVPPLTMSVPAVLGPAPDAVPAVAPSVAVSRVGVETPSPIRVSELLMVMWGLGVLLNVALLVVALGRLRRLAATAVPVTDATCRRTAHECAAALDVRRRVVLLQSERSEMPATWGVRRPAILLPTQARNWNHERIHAVLCHELAHIRRRDWLVQLAAESLAQSTGSTRWCGCSAAGSVARPNRHATTRCCVSGCRRRTTRYIWSKWPEAAGGCSPNRSLCQWLVGPRWKGESPPC